MKSMKRAAYCFVCFSVLAFSILLGANAFAEQEISISAAASLTDAFKDIGKKFGSANPGIKVHFNFAASGDLLQQVDKGVSHADVFAFADEKTMDQAKEKNLIIPDTRQNFVRNELALILPDSSKTTVKSLQDLTDKGIAKIAIGNPETVPAGRYAREVLTKAGLWEELKPKLVYGESVRQVLDEVSRGKASAGFVFTTDASVAKNTVKVALEPETLKPIVYPISIAAATGNKDLAERFVKFVGSSQGREILSMYGFKPCAEGRC